MRGKWLFGLGITATALIALYFIIKLDTGLAVLSMLAMFTLTNSARFSSFQKQGMKREATLMLGVSLFFGMGFIVWAILLLFA